MESMALQRGGRARRQVAARRSKQCADGVGTCSFRATAFVAESGSQLESPCNCKSKGRRQKGEYQPTNTIFYRRTCACSDARNSSARARSARALRGCSACPCGSCCATSGQPKRSGVSNAWSRRSYRSLLSLTAETAATCDASSSSMGTGFLPNKPPPVFPEKDNVTSPTAKSFCITTRH